jgi:ATP-binding cassette subfamily C (CFTR/MRP) protein 1
MSSVLRHIKSIKLSAYEPLVQSRAEDLRETEITALIKWIIEILRVSIVTNWLGNFLSLVTVSTYTVVSLYTGDGQGGVSTAKVFTIVSTITLISNPLLMLGQNMGQIVSAWASVKRVEEFLLQDEKVDKREKEGSRTESDSQRIVLKDASFGV